MGDTKIKVGGKLFAVTANGALAEASQIIDVNQGNKNQQDINKEFKAALAKKKRIYMKFVQNTPAYFEGSWLNASPGETVCMAIQATASTKSLTVTVVPLSANKATPTVTATKVGTNSLSGTMVLWKVSITIPEDVEDNDIYLYKYHMSTT